MSNLPVVSGQDCVKALEKEGYYIRRQRGSHIILRRDLPFSQVVVPNHATIDRGTLRRIISDAGLDVEEFVRLLKK